MGLTQNKKQFVNTDYYCGYGSKFWLQPGNGWKGQSGVAE